MLLILDFTLGVLKELDSKGISWGALLTAILLWNKLMRNKEFKARDERVERNQQRIMAHLGVEGEWSTPRKTLTQTALQSLRRWYYSLQAVIAQVFQLRRGRKMMQFLTTSISKKLAAFLITAAITAANNKFELNIDPNEMYGLYAVMIAYIAGQAHVDAKKLASNAVNAVATAITEATSTTDGTDIKTITTMPMNFTEARPYLVEVSADIKVLYDQIQSGKVTDASRNALNAVMTIHEYLQKNKGA